MSTNGELVSGVDFLPVPTHDLGAGGAVLRGHARAPALGVHARPNFAEFETGNLTLSVIHAEKMGLEHHVSGNAIALHVDDVEAARKALEEQGVTFNGDTLDTSVCHMAFFSDPDGNALMLHHRYAPRVTEA